MKIAVNTRFLLKEYLEGYGHFIYEVVSRMAAKHPEHEFILMFDRPFDSKFISGSNCRGVVVGPPARHPILWKYWYDVSIKSALKKYSADVFLSCDGFCSLTTAVPQCLVIHDLAFLHFPEGIKRSHLYYYKRYTSKFLRKADSVVTVSEFSKKDIIQNYPLVTSKIDVVYNAAREIFKPIEISKQQEIKDRFTDGRNYFIYTGAIHPRKNLINLLKAFSIFKKRQKSDWKLVIAGRLAWKFEKFNESLKTYKYRDDVVMTGYVEEVVLVELLGAAYGMIYPSVWEGFGMPVLEAMSCEVPVITSAGSAMQEIAGEAALYANVEDYHDLADKMMLLYKDETLRTGLIQKGLERKKDFSWERTTDLVWQALMKATGNRFG